MNFSKKTLGFVALLMVALMTTGCFGIFDKDEGDFTITATVNDSKMGEVTGVDSGYDKDAVTEITAVAKPGYIFSHWEGVDEEFAKDNPLRITVTEDLEIEAVFEVDESYVEETIVSLEDTYIRADEKDNSKATEGILAIKKVAEDDGWGNSRIAFLKFDVSEWSSVSTATLKLSLVTVHNFDAHPSRPLEIFDVTGEEWTAEELTWNIASDNQTLFGGGTSVATFDVETDEAGEVFEIDVTDLIKKHVLAGADEVSIRIESSVSHWEIVTEFASSRAEDEATHPVLVVGGNK